MSRVRMPPEIVVAYRVQIPEPIPFHYPWRCIYFIAFMDQSIYRQQQSANKSMLLDGLPTIGGAGRVHVAAITINRRDILTENYKSAS